MRYFNLLKFLSNPKLKMFLHAVNGFIIMIITIVLSKLAKEEYGDDMEDTVHGQLGAAVMIITIVITAGGVLAWASSFFGSSKFWGVFRLLKVKEGHKILGWMLLVISQVSTLLGVIQYNSYLDSDPTLGAVNLGVFLFIWGLIEIWY